jgi:hypothetical protein
VSANSKISGTDVPPAAPGRKAPPTPDLANSEAKANASRRLDNAVVEGNYVPARARKNEQFDTAPGRNDELPADDVFGAIDRIRHQANDLAPGTLPNDFMRRLDALRPRHRRDDRREPRRPRHRQRWRSGGPPQVHRSRD